MKTHLAVLVIVATLSPAASVAQEKQLDPAETVEALHEAMAQGDKAGVLALLDPAVTIFESGGAELSREEYSSHHLGSDMEFSAATERTILDQQAGRGELYAWVTTRSETRGLFRGKERDLQGTETMLLERSRASWKIVHIHWSSRARSAGH